MATFKLETAVPLPLGTIPGPHGVYRDANGALLLWADSPLRGGGVAVNADALEAFRGLEGPKFMRLTNPKVRLDRVMPLEEVPRGEGHRVKSTSHVFFVSTALASGPPDPSSFGTSQKGGRKGFRVGSVSVSPEPDASEDHFRWVPLGAYLAKRMEAVGRGDGPSRCVE